MQDETEFGILTNMDYELVVLTKTDYGKKVAGDVQDAVGGKNKIIKTDDWGTKALAYKIQKQTEAAYFSFTLNLDPSEVSPLDETLRRNENVLRHLLVRTEKAKKLKNKKTEKPEKKEKAKKEVSKKTEKKTTKKEGKK